MEILKRLCVVVLIGCLFLCGSGFSNKYEDVQIIELKSNPSTGFRWKFEVLASLMRPEAEIGILQTFESNSKDNLICGTCSTEISTISYNHKNSWRQLDFFF